LHERTLVRGVLFVPGIAPVHLGSGDSCCSRFLFAALSASVVIFFAGFTVANRGKSKKLCLTFDDGPDPALTNDVLDMLGRYGFTATFFVIGNKAANHPEIVKKGL